jgi:glutathione synthase/RimK-type ligase-like ATP-grasp enzyme
MILLWGLKADAPMNLVREELERAGVNFFFLDHHKIFRSEIEYAFDPKGGMKCVINIDGAVLDLDLISVTYTRPYNFMDFREMDGKAADDPMAIKASGFETQLMAWLNASDSLVINKADPSATNNSKPYQLDLIRKAGFKIPETFVSNDPGQVMQFLKRADRAVYKSVSAVRSIVHEVADEHLGFIEDVQWCPTLFQKVVDGINYRVHVIGPELFAVRITSDQLDYRYGQTSMVVEKLPADIAEKCLLVNEMLGLHFSGIDLMRTPDDEWYCFEVNASPGYSYFESNCGVPISVALAKFMTDADRRVGFSNQPELQRL